MKKAEKRDLFTHWWIDKIVYKKKEIFGKIMSIPDDLIYFYFELLTDVSENDLLRIERESEDKKTNPMILKKRLGKEIVSMY
jgi:tyrosyl-tRNA synthetase